MSGFGNPETACLGGASLSPQEVVAIRAEIGKQREIYVYASTPENQAYPHFDGNDAERIAGAALDQIFALKSKLYSAGIDARNA